jgi:hypothetical protein
MNKTILTKIVLFISMFAIIMIAVVFLGSITNHSGLNIPFFWLRISLSTSSSYLDVVVDDYIGWPFPFLHYSGPHGGNVVTFLNPLSLILNFIIFLLIGKLLIDGKSLLHKIKTRLMF